MVATGPVAGAAGAGLATELLVVGPFGSWVAGAVSEVWVEPVGLQVLLQVGPAGLVWFGLVIYWLCVAVNQALTGSASAPLVLVQVGVFLEIPLLTELVAERLVAGETGTDVWVVGAEG